MISPEQAEAIYIDFIAKHTDGQQAGKLTSLTLPFSYPDGEAIRVYLRDMPNGLITVTDYGHTCSFLSQYGALDVRPKHVVSVVEELCKRYEATFLNGEVQVSAPARKIAESLCCITEAIQAVAGMIVVADVLHSGGGGGQQVVTRLKSRLKEAGLENVHRKEPLEVYGKSKVHNIRFAYPDRSTLILTQSLKGDPDDKARQVAFDGIDIGEGYSERDAEKPSLICVYQSPTDEKSRGKLGDVLCMLESWFEHVFDVEKDAQKLVKHISGDLREISGHRLFGDN